MRKKTIKYAVLYSFIPLFLLGALIFCNILLQPKEFALGVKDNVPTESYIDPNTTYYLSGDIECYPKVVIAPNNFEHYSSAKLILHSLSDIRREACKTHDTYMATIRFFIDAPGSVDYAVIFPGSFCEYIFFANRSTVAYTTTFRSDNPVYPSPQVIVLPHSDDGTYEVILYIITPVSSTPSTNETILFGTAERMRFIRNFGISTSIILVAFVLATMCFCLIQLVAMQKEKIVVSFLLFSMALILRILFSDDIIIMNYIPHMPYQLGTVLQGLTMPVLLLTLLYHEFCMYPVLFNRTVTLFVCLSQVIPLINTLTMHTVLIFEYLTYAAYAAPFIFSLYIFFRAHSERYPHTILFGLGLVQYTIAGAAEFICSFMIMGARYVFIWAFMTFAIVDMIILARRYAEQRESELYYTEELNRTLEAMQASENAFLNAQMKPHFLYNTLNTIADLCVTEPAKAQSLIDSLKDYCRLILSIDNMDKTVPLTQEMELVSAYTSIEKERFPSINFYTDYPIRMPKVEIPPLTLQPLIENAIKHGVRKNDKPGVVTLRIRDSYDSVTFYVSDNGVGMNEETMSKLFIQPKENKSIGVYNIDKRLKNLYHSGLEVDSTINLGTCISFTVPK